MNFPKHQERECKQIKQITHEEDYRFVCVSIYNLYGMKQYERINAKHIDYMNKYMYRLKSPIKRKGFLSWLTNSLYVVYKSILQTIQGHFTMQKTTIWYEDKTVISIIYSIT